MLVSDLRQLLSAIMRVVLILVLVDVGLGRGMVSMARCVRTVLILVLVDVGLGRSVFSHRRKDDCLNPCFSGCWSRTARIY